MIYTACRYKAQSTGGPLDDPTPEYMNLLGMVFSMCGLMMKVWHSSAIVVRSCIVSCA